MCKALVVGVDIGTQGARVVITDLLGEIAADYEVRFKTVNEAKKEGYQEQSPAMWWDAAVKALSCCITKIGNLKKNICTLSIDGTSGTVVALDREFEELYPGIMYNDSRAVPETERIRLYAGNLERVLGYRVNASFGLPKMLWLNEHLGGRVAYFIHQSDYICGKLTNEYLVTDYSNALKSCYDLTEDRWPGFMSGLGLDDKMLPAVVPPGTVIGRVSAKAALATGLPKGVKVVAGATDGYASSLSSGIADVGDWSTVIGTTMVLKGIEKDLVTDVRGRVYSHKHPQGYWMLGGASNVGGYCLNEVKGKYTYEEMNVQVKRHTPTGIPCYPLSGKGERFPFVSPAAQRVFLADNADPYRCYTAFMEGIGYAERLAYEVLTELGCKISDTIYSSGGACNSSEWLQIRSDILSRRIRVPAHTGAALGTALIASLAVGYDNLKQASRNMVKIASEVEPSKRCGFYEEGYLRTRLELQKRGYLS